MLNSHMLSCGVMSPRRVGQAECLPGSHRERVQHDGGQRGDLHSLHQLVDDGWHDQDAALPQDPLCYEGHLHPPCTSQPQVKNKGNVITPMALMLHR